MDENAQCYAVWLLCNNYGRDGFSGCLRIDALLDTCRGYGLSRVEFERIVALENEVARIKEEKRQAEEQEKKRGR